MTSNTTTDPGNKSPDEIEREVDQTRDDLTATVAALQARLSSENIVDNVLQSLSKNGGEVSRNLGRTVRDNPLPIILTGVGLAWLMAQSNQSRTDSLDASNDRDLQGSWDGESADPEPWDRSAADAALIGEPGPAIIGDPGPAVIGEPGSGLIIPGSPPGDQPVALDETSGSTVPSSPDASADAASGPSMGDRAGAALARAKQRSGALSGDARARAQRARERAGRASGDVSARAEKFVEEQPLIVAALGFAMGLGIGGILPRTRTEDQLLGPKADAAKASARQMADKQRAKASAIAGAVANEAMTMADEGAGAVGGATPAGSEIVERAKSEAASAADRLTQAGMAEAKKHE